MTWARVDDGWWSHPKVLGLSMAARGLWTTALSWSCTQRSDFVPASFVTMVCPNGEAGPVVGQLVESGLWEPVGDEANAKQTGWRIHDWDDYQHRTLSEKRADAGRKGGLASGESRRPSEANPKQIDVASGSKRQANAEAGIPTRPEPNPTQPVPDRKSLVASSRDEGAETVEQFEHFWSAYPDRDGRKRGKKNALIEWRRLNLDERRRAYIGATHLAASSDLPKDAERFLRRAKGGKGDFPFDDYQQQVVARSRDPNRATFDRVYAQLDQWEAAHGAP